VKSLVGIGTKQSDIAPVVGIRSEKTLRKHFREELDRGALEANSKVAQTLFQMATSGKCIAATVFWMKSRAGWTERSFGSLLPASPSPFIVQGSEA
jgi:hypothetical protein